MSLQPVICVDLDETLIKTDLFFEGISRLMSQKPWLLLLLPFWCMAGRPYLKKQLVRHVAMDVSSLPYNHRLIRYLKKNQDRKIVLATASPEAWARKVADYLGIFSEVLATNDTINLKGRKKSALLEERYGKQGYCYAGDCGADLPVWEKSGNAIVVSRSEIFFRNVEKMAKVEGFFRVPRAGTGSFFKLLRIHQWVKNLLLFLPLILAHSFGDVSKIWDVCVGFILFGLNASWVYIVNDIADLEADRVHASKKKRLIASGRVTIRTGLSVAAGLFVATTLMGFFLLGNEYGWAALGYAAATLAYTFYFKKIFAMDVFILAGFYTFRIYLGGIIADVPISAWLAAFSMFFFLNLAFVKRFVELEALLAYHKEKAANRGYRVEDSELVRTMGIASGYISVMIFTLYIHSESVRVLYRNSAALWFIGILLLYWITRLWFLANRKKMDSDPIVFALKDKASYLLGLVVAIVLWLAI